MAEGNNEINKFMTIIHDLVNGLVDVEVETTSIKIAEEIIRTINECCAITGEFTKRRVLIYNTIIKRLEKELEDISGELKVSDG